jgi:hypothetical protein
VCRAADGALLRGSTAVSCTRTPARAIADNDCLFRVKRKKGYEGRQTDRNRFTLNFETGGLAQFRYAANQPTVGARPSIRIVAGLGFGHTSVLAGWSSRAAR